MENRILLQKIKETASKKYHLGSHKLNLTYLFVVVVGFAVFFLIFPKPESKEDKQVLVKSKSVCDDILKNEKMDPVVKFEGTPAPVNFSRFPEAKLFYTVITEGAASGPNYGGHFTFIHWGCGTDCFSYAIVDSITGDIISYSGGENLRVTWPPSSYSLESRLLVINKIEPDSKLRSKSLGEAIEDLGYLASAPREYHIITESDWDGGHIWLNNVCTENVLDGLYSEVQ